MSNLMHRNNKFDLDLDGKRKWELIHFDHDGWRSNKFNLDAKSALNLWFYQSNIKVKIESIIKYLFPFFQVNYMSHWKSVAPS